LGKCQRIELDPPELESMWHSGCSKSWFVPLRDEHAERGACHVKERSQDPVSIGVKLVESQGFGSLFREGMALIEETAAYLDGTGRAEAKDLSRLASLAYATESMRLTTRLMQIAAWLLLQRAVNEGELDPTQVREDKHRIKLQSLSTARSGTGYDELPEKLKELVDRSVRLQTRVTHLDAALYGTVMSEETSNAVARELARLEAAFKREGE
jgi:regulator of CtrA degradation